MEDYKIPRGVEQCGLHSNLTKEIGIIKDLEIKMSRKLDKVYVIFWCLVGLVGLDTVMMILNSFYKLPAYLALLWK